MNIKKMNELFSLSFYRGKKVLITGHTGFKGSWMSVILVKAGAKVIGYSSCREKSESLFECCGIKDQLTHIKGDVRDLGYLQNVMEEYQPEIVIHMAAQPIVREGYKDPVNTYYTNVMGTVNVCEAIRHVPSVRSFLNITTDKVYENKEWQWGYRENEFLDGFDPYSNSKSCSELVTHCYVNSYFAERDISISTARAGNVIGGGDFAKDRIIPDCVRAAVKGEDIFVRNPFSIRPYQHVLEPVFAYLLIAARQYENRDLASWYNIGPDESDCLQTGELVDLFVKCWGEGIKRKDRFGHGPHEANYLKLDCSKFKTAFGWRPRWSIETAVEKVVEWSKVWRDGEDTRSIMDKQIDEYLSS